MYTLPKNEQEVEILLINVPTSYEQNVIPDDAAPPFGLLRIVVASREIYGKKVSLLDAHNLKLSPEEIKTEISLIKPNLVGLNPTSINIIETKVISQFCDEQNLPYIIGGVAATLDPTSIRKEFPNAFAIVRGGGEIAINEILEDFKNPNKENIRNGIYYRRDSDSGRHDYAKDINLNELPIIDQSKYVPKPIRQYSQTIDGKNINLRELSIYTTRGCPFDCSFCSSPIMHPELPEFGVKKYSRPDTKKIIQEIKFHIDKLGINAIHFVDDMAFATKKHIEEFCNGLEKENLSNKLYWRMMSRIDFLDNISDEHLELMKKYGLWKLGVGIESGNQEILNSVNKKIRIEQVERVLARTKRQNIDIKAFFMMGYPNETRDQLEDTSKMITELAKKNLIGDLALFQLKPYPGTKIFDSIKENPKIINSLTYLRTEGGIKGDSETERIQGSTPWLPDNLKISMLESGEIRRKVESTYEEFKQIKRGQTKNNELAKFKIQ